MSKSSKLASHNDSSESTLVPDEQPEKDKPTGRGFKFRIFKAPKSGRVIKRIDILREGWSNRVFKDLNTNVFSSPPQIVLGTNPLLEGFVPLEFSISLVWSTLVFPSKGSRRKSHHDSLAETVFPCNDNLLSRRFGNFSLATDVPRDVGMARFRGPRTREVVVLITLRHGDAGECQGRGE
jgi:hypothetical protein